MLERTEVNSLSQRMGHEYLQAAFKRLRIILKKHPKIILEIKRYTDVKMGLVVINHRTCTDCKRVRLSAQTNTVLTETSFYFLLN